MHDAIRRTAEIIERQLVLPPDVEVIVTPALDPEWATRNAPTFTDLPIPMSRHYTPGLEDVTDYHLWWRMRRAFLPIVVTDPAAVLKSTAVW